MRPALPDNLVIRHQISKIGREMRQNDGGASEGLLEPLDLNDPEREVGAGPESGISQCLYTSAKDLLSFVPPFLMIAGAQYADYKIDPYQRNEFDYKDGPSISFPLKESIVDDTKLLLLAWIIPTVTIVAVTAVLKTNMKHMHHALLGLAESAAYSYTIVVIGKKCAGSLRPCFKAMCEWDEQLQACMGDHFAIRDARQSFPSGHSAAASAGLGFLTLFISRELQVPKGV